MVPKSNFAARAVPFFNIVCNVLTVLALLLLACLFILLHEDANAGELFVDLGQSTYHKPDSGVYWQNGHSYTQDMKAAYVRAGYEYPVAKHFAIAGSAFTLGTYQLDAQATPFDDQYNPNTENYCNGPCPAMNTWVTRGNVNGISLTAKFHYRGAFIEAGPTYNYQTLSLHVFHPDGSDVTGYQVDNLRERGLGYTLGAGFEYKQVRIGMVFYQFDSDYQDIRFSEATMPGGVTNAYAGYVGWRF